MPFADNDLRLGSISRELPIIEGLLRPGQTAIIAGLPTSGLTTVGLDLALAVAHGRSWLCERTRRVETTFHHHLPEDEAAIRLAGWQSSHGQIDGSYFKCEQLEPRLARELTEPPQTQDEADFEKVSQLIGPHDGSKLVVIDTLQDAFFFGALATLPNMADMLYFSQRHKDDRGESNAAVIFTIRIRPERDAAWLQSVSPYADLVLFLTTPAFDERRGARELLVLKNASGHTRPFRFPIRRQRVGVDNHGHPILCPTIPPFAEDEPPALAPL